MGDMPLCDLGSRKMKLFVVTPLLPRDGGTA